MAGADRGGPSSSLRHLSRGAGLLGWQAYTRDGGWRPRLALPSGHGGCAAVPPTCRRPLILRKERTDPDKAGGLLPSSLACGEKSALE